jgi:hypothetical protein
MPKGYQPLPVKPDAPLPAHQRAKGNVKTRTLRQLIDRYAGKDGEKIVQTLCVLAFGDSEGRRNLFNEHVRCDANVRMAALRELACRRWGTAPQILEDDADPNHLPITIVNVYSPVPIGQPEPETKQIAARAV